MNNNFGQVSNYAAQAMSRTNAFAQHTARNYRKKVIGDAAGGDSPNVSDGDHQEDDNETGQAQVHQQELEHWNSDDEMSGYSNIKPPPRTRLRRYFSQNTLDLMNGLLALYAAYFWILPLMLCYWWIRTVKRFVMRYVNVIWYTLMLLLEIEQKGS